MARFKTGTPEELSETLMRTWMVIPEGWRIVQDISRIPSTAVKIVEHRGGVVPDDDMRHGRRCNRSKRPIALHPAATAAANKLLSELGSEVKSARVE